MQEAIQIKVNGDTHTLTADPESPLLYVLRNSLGLNGPKFGCGLGQCGACMVLMDGNAVPSCQVQTGRVGDAEIRTLEGLADQEGGLHPVQQAIIDEQATQCGYCLNGMIMAGVSLLHRNNNPSEAEIRNSLQPNICRCGVHPRVIRAIKRAAGQ